jgi:hypothetical protein
MSHARIRKIFSALLADYAESKNIDVSFDNVTLTSDGDRIESHLIPSDTFSDTLSGDHNAYIGMFQMTLVVQYNNGLLEVESMVEELQVIFKNNKVFTDSSGFSVQVISPIKTPEGRQSGVQWRVPCYFEYRADTN